jgi:hypothetical protein
MMSQDSNDEVNNANKLEEQDIRQSDSSSQNSHHITDKETGDTLLAPYISQSPKPLQETEPLSPHVRNPGVS